MNDKLVQRKNYATIFKIRLIKWTLRVCSIMMWQKDDG